MAKSTDPMLLRVVGMDPSLRHWGLAVGTYHLLSKQLLIERVDVINPVISKSKQVRQNSLDIDSAKQLYASARVAAQDAQAIFIEVPVGSQSARAMASYGICVGVLGSLQSEGIPFFEMTPTEIKLAGPGIKTATKQQMIEWAVSTHPEANWPYYKRNGVSLVSESTAEHQADAIAAIHAGLACQSFLKVLPFIRPR